MKNKTSTVLFLCVLIYSSVQANTNILTILQTSDLHGRIMPYDYFQQKSADLGLAAVAHIIQQERQQDPDLLLIDGGDTNQGTPLISVYLSQMQTQPNPMALAMNYLQYDAMTVGNHEFNFGQHVLNRFIEEADFPVLSANIQNQSGSHRFTPFIIKQIKGLRVGILGLTTNGIRVWEKPAHIQGLQFADPVETAKKQVRDMQKEGVDIILGLVHAGPERQPAHPRNPESWQTDTAGWAPQGYDNIPDENFALKLIENVPEIDILFTGHTHLNIPGVLIQNTLLVQPDCHGRGLAKVVLSVDDSGRIMSRHAEFLSSNIKRVDSTMVQLVQPWHQQTLKAVNQPIGLAASPFTGGMQARVQDSPLLDLINSIQMDMAAAAGIKADISATALFNNQGALTDTITISHIYTLYPYDNTLTAIRITGCQLRTAIEHSAACWQSNGQMNPKARFYNWDMLTGIDYTLNLCNAPGQRIHRLEKDGLPIESDTVFTMLINNYRAGGGGGYAVYTECETIWESTQTIRNAIIKYIQKKQKLSPEDYFEQNWHLISDR